MTAVKLCDTHKHLSAINTKLTVNTYHYSDIVKQDESQLKSSATPHTVLAFATKIFELKVGLLNNYHVIRFIFAIDI